VLASTLRKSDFELRCQDLRLCTVCGLSIHDFNLVTCILPEHTKSCVKNSKRVFHEYYCIQ
jgi:hypothetical protein